MNLTKSLILILCNSGINTLNIIKNTTKLAWKDYRLRDMLERKIVWIAICTLISNSAYALIAPFLPLEFKDKGISGEMIGMMFAIYSVAVIICSPMVGQTVQYVGNTNMISLGIAVMGLAFVFFGFIPNMD